MKKTIIFAGFIGILLAGAANAAGDTQVATVKKVDASVNTVNQAVVTLNNRANTDADTVSTHAGDITDMNNGKQTIPSNPNGCQGLDTNTYSGCGYISVNGTGDGKTASGYQLVMIAK